jgi:hypothetical protein
MSGEDHFEAKIEARGDNFIHLKCWNLKVGDSTEIQRNVLAERLRSRKGGACVHCVPKRRCGKMSAI